MRAVRLTVLAVLVGGLAAVAGCGPAGPPLYPVTGRVVLKDGRPVEGAVVEFAADDGLGARGRTGADGRYELKTGDRPGAVAGRHRVAVLQMVVADGAAKHVQAHRPVLAVHPKYAKFESSGLTRDVTVGANDIPIVVDPADGKRSGW